MADPRARYLISFSFDLFVIACEKVDGVDGVGDWMTGLDLAVVSGELVRNVVLKRER
jgi:hypothetical protein